MVAGHNFSVSQTKRGGICRNKLKVVFSGLFVTVFEESPSVDGITDINSAEKKKTFLMCTQQFPVVRTYINTY